jgi:tetratricopeptide (TPR) repeat protein
LDSEEVETEEPTLTGEDIASKIGSIEDTPDGAESVPFADDDSGLKMKIGEDSEKEISEAHQEEGVEDDIAETVVLEESELNELKEKEESEGSLKDEEATEQLPDTELINELKPDEEPPVHTNPLNVATVTLAEIYFKQGLKEQAIEIYAQLLEREPDNQEIVQRIEVIKRSNVKPTEDAGGEQEPRKWPHPGVKIKKKKK